MPSRPQSSYAKAAAGAAGALVVVLLMTSGCASAPKTDRLPPQTMSSSPAPEVPEAEVEAREGSAERAASEVDPRETVPGDPAVDRPGGGDGLTVVIEDGGAAEDRRRTLVEAAAAERERRKSSGRQIAVITNENLKDYATGQLTESEVVTVPSEVEGDPATAAGDTGSADSEAYWRGRVLRARMSWAEAVEEIAHLDAKIAELRQRFYAEEDPYYRDSRIKPSWDRALDRLEEAKASAETHREEVRAILDEGRKAGALPGWLREGLELEPHIEEREATQGPVAPGEYEPGEPQVAKDPDGRTP